MSGLIDLTGQSFGRLTVSSRAPNTFSGHVRWNCRCACGNMAMVCSDNLRSSNTRSCGCLHREISQEVCREVRRVYGKAASRARVTHGHSCGVGVTQTYSSWQSMKHRCQNKTATRFKNYGGRGIRVCKRWLNSFENFLADMGKRPAGTTLDRYPDNDGNYEPGNCRWATPKQQARNRRRRTA